MITEDENKLEHTLNVTFLIDCDVFPWTSWTSLFAWRNSFIYHKCVERRHESSYTMCEKSICIAFHTVVHICYTFTKRYIKDQHKFTKQ